MFTGLIQTLGRVSRVCAGEQGTRLRIECPALSGQIAVDDSIASNGVCLTAESVDESGFTAFVMPVTLQKTALAHVAEGDTINLELALRFGDRLGGHLVQGHVNGTGRLRGLAATGENWLIDIEVPQHLRRYLIEEGSIAIDGISLTVARLAPDGLCVSIIPHTWANTNLHTRQIGDAVNIEIDVLTKTIEGLLRADPSLATRWQTVAP
jgi:riboflavin synthase